MRYLAVVIVIVLIVAVAGIYFFSTADKTNPQIVYSDIGEGDYRAIRADLAGKIDDLSPTPPTEQDWIITDVEFAKNSNMAYVIYHDTHNIFRLLLDIHKVDGKYFYQVKATFEPIAGGWQKQFGEDLAAGRELIRIE